MKNSIIILLTCLLAFCSCVDDKDNEYIITPAAPVAVTKSNDMKLYVHYMPWFESKTSNGGTWGSHWKMSRCNPDSMDATGRRNIASHYYPLIGPYASGDPDLIEYHLLLMKYAGIDGVLIDWYGSYNVYDTYKLTRNSNAIIDACKKVGLEFAIIYEDRTIPSVMLNTGNKDTVELAVGDMAFILNSYMKRSNYINVNNSPLLGVFGPDFINQPGHWTSVLSVFTRKPHFIIPYGEHVAGKNFNYFYSRVGAENCSSVYLWPWGAWWDDDKTTDKNDHGNDINRTKRVWEYLQTNNIEVFAGAWPGFHSYYYQGDGRDSLFFLDYRQGMLWTDMLNLAKEKNAKHIQLITWNDFGEGTMIEPTREFGFSFLNALQSFAGTTTNSSQLEQILELFKLRKEFRNNSYKQAQLDQAFYYFVSMQTQKAIDLMNQVK